MDLQQEELQRFNITVVPLTIYIDEESYLDGVEISPSTFIEKMKQSKELPKSSQPSIGRFVEVYNELGKDGSDILSIHMTGGMSGTVQAAEAASKICDANVTVVDSRYISKALAFQVVEAANMAAEGKQINEIIAKLEEIRKQTKLYVVVDTLENLVKGGRIGKGKAFIGSLLNIKPIANLDNGEYNPVTKARSHSQVVKFLSKKFVEDIKNKKIMSVGLVHAEGLELARKLKEKIIELTGFDKIEIEETTPIISTHTGIGAIGFMYWLE